MRTQRLIDGFNNSQKIRVIVAGVGFYTTVGGTSDIMTRKHRMAVQTALMNLASDRQLAKAVGRRETPIGFGFNYNYYDGTERDTVDVQVDLV